MSFKANCEKSWCDAGLHGSEPWELLCCQLGMPRAPDPPPRLPDSVHQSDPRPANATYCLSQTECLTIAHPLWKDVCVLMSLQELVQKHNFFWQLTPDTCPILIFTFSSVIWYQNVSGKHLFELDGSFHHCTMTLLWRFQSNDEWGWPQKVIFLACTHASADFSRYALYSSLSITQCKWQQWVLNLYFVASPANRRPYSIYACQDDVHLRAGRPHRDQDGAPGSRLHRLWPLPGQGGTS